MKYESTDKIAVSLLKEAVKSKGCHFVSADSESKF